MNERELLGLVEGVRSGALSRRDFIERMARIGVAAPLSSQLLAWHGIAMAQRGQYRFNMNRGCQAAEHDHHDHRHGHKSLIVGMVHGMAGSGAL